MKVATVLCLDMNIENLKKYKNLYKSAELMGAARILRDYLKVDEDFPIPLSISHGVDMNHCPTAMDVESVEPIHWSCNNLVHERALKVKPSVKLPHPWLILKASRVVKPGAGVLVIGPPPGKSNDRALLDCLQKLKLGSFHLLLKHRGEIDLSQKFWDSNGITVVTAGPQDDFFYDRLFDLIQNYEIVIGCTLSSALFFAASIDRKCVLVDNYTYSAYDTSDYLEFVDFNSSVAKKFVQLLKSDDCVTASNMALDVLGKDFLIESNELKSELSAAMIALENPVHFGENVSILSREIVLFLSKVFSKTGLIRYGFYDYFKRKVNNRISLIKVNEIDIWLNGLSEKNFSSQDAKYIKGVTEPGWAVD